jgi:hypothetical protein
MHLGAEEVSAPIFIFARLFRFVFPTDLETFLNRPEPFNEVASVSLIFLGGLDCLRPFFTPEELIIIGYLRIRWSPSK